MSSESLFKRLVDIGAAGINKAYETISGVSPDTPQRDYYSGEITPVAPVLPAPTAWEKFRLNGDIVTRSVNGAAATRVDIPVTGQPERLDFNFNDTIAIGQFHEYRFGPPPTNEIWRMHGVNFFTNGDADLLIRSQATAHFLNTGAVGVARPNYFGEFEGLLTADGVFRAGPAVVQVKAEPTPWDMFERRLPGFLLEPFLIIRVTNEEAAAALNVTFTLALVRAIRAAAAETPR